MTFPEPSISDGVFMKRTVEAIRIGVIAGLIAWCFMIARPFLIPIIWGAIIAVAVFHGYERLQTGLGGRRITAAVLVSPGWRRTRRPTQLLSLASALRVPDACLKLGLSMLFTAL